MAATYTFDGFFTLDGYGSYAPDGDWVGTGGARPEPRPPPALYDDDQRIVFGANTVLRTDFGRLQVRFDKEAVMAVGVFAGVPVRDYTSAVKWYELLLGAEASFYPNEVEAVWQLAEDRYVYIVEDQKRAGGAVSLIWVDDPVAEAARIAERGLEPVKVEKYDTVWKYVFHDADGNEIGVGGNVPSGEQG